MCRRPECRVATVRVNVGGTAHTSPVYQVRLRFESDAGFGCHIGNLRKRRIDVDEFDQVFLVELDREDNAGIVVSRAPQCRDGGVLGVRSFLQHPVVHGEIEAAEVVPSDEICHAGHRVRPEGGRAAVEQQFRALHGDARDDGIDVGAVPAGAVGNGIVDRSAAIEHDEGILVTESAQVDRGITDGARSALAVVLRLVDIRTGKILRNVVEEG